MKFTPAVKAGPLANGFERGKGRVVHAINLQYDGTFDGLVASLCGDRPAICWSERYDAEITCKKCLKKLNKETL
jgi:hypothetical protein